LWVKLNNTDSYVTIKKANNYKLYKIVHFEYWVVGIVTTSMVKLAIRGVGPFIIYIGQFHQTIFFECDYSKR